MVKQRQAPRVRFVKNGARAGDWRGSLTPDIRKIQPAVWCRTPPSQALGPAGTGPPMWAAQWCRHRLRWGRHGGHHSGGFHGEGCSVRTIRCTRDSSAVGTARVLQAPRPNNGRDVRRQPRYSACRLDVHRATHSGGQTHSIDLAAESERASHFMIFLRLAALLRANYSMGSRKRFTPGAISNRQNNVRTVDAGVSD